MAGLRGAFFDTSVLIATENRRHFTSLLRHGIRVLVSAELADEIGR